MQAILYIAHGSRVQAGVEEARSFIETVKPQIQVEIQEMCFLELAKPSIEEGIASCVARGATSIAIIPILLLSANHAKQDIPDEVEQALKQYTNVSVTIGKPLGIHHKLIETIHERVLEKDLNIELKRKVLLVGRGSSDPDVQRDLNQIASEVQKNFQYDEVDTCFLYGKGTSFEDALLKLEKEEQRRQVYIVPYLLFTGLLKIGIQKKIGKAFSNHEVVLCECLGYNEKVREVLVERVNETLYSMEGAF